jgi:FAD/FMN-containing dehydrogenase
MPKAGFMVLMEFETAGALGLREAVEGTLSEAINAGEIQDVLIAENESQAHAFWAVRESISAGHRPEGAQVNHDISVPVSKTPAFLHKAGDAVERMCPGARIVAFGHMGDGNFHYTVMIPEGTDPATFQGAEISSVVNETAVGMGGSISAEHGIGAARRADLARFKDPHSIALMRAVKAALDPNGVMNPRVLLP